ncbi:MAG: hypothetical protein XXXJIFNMEKO3_02992 [Candidatus Erwinia impunctatus]|nr:hypothetical protein XXXJIFNMEKO_02992 [Culicoides impunctatus]
MAFHTWQVGLDIQNGMLCAVAIKRRRQGWQLCHWWSHALPLDTLHNGFFQHRVSLVALLQRWRQMLPHRLSLRVGLPPQSVLQHRASWPVRELAEPMRSQYVTANAKRLFPLALEELVVDYRTAGKENTLLTMTAIRQETLNDWLACLHQARLFPDVMDIAPSALFVLSGALAIPPGAVLVHRLFDHWLWYGAAQQEPHWGWCPLQDAEDFSHLKSRFFPHVHQCYYSGIDEQTPPAGSFTLPVLDALTFKHPPLPSQSGALALAIGLALRPEEQAWC